MAHDKYEHYRERMWWTWHYYVMQRTRDEITELIDQDLERATGEDYREWPEIINVEETD